MLVFPGAPLGFTSSRCSAEMLHEGTSEDDSGGLVLEGGFLGQQALSDKA